MSIIRKKWKIGALIHPMIDSDFEIMQYLQISLERVPFKTKHRKILSLRKGVWLSADKIPMRLKSALLSHEVNHI